MRLNIKQTLKKFNEDNYNYESIKIARDFTKSLLKEVPNLIKSVILFGSTAISKNNNKSDIDILVIINDVSVIITKDFKEAYFTILNHIVSSVSEKLHITTMNLTDFWDLSRNGDPIIINILRTGYALYDESIFETTQILLKQGRIKATFETALNYRNRSLNIIEENNAYLKDAIRDLYYAVSDMAHSCLILKKVSPPSPKEIGRLFEKHFKGTELEKYSLEINDFYKIFKDLEYGIKKKVDGKLYDEYYERAEKIIKGLNKYFNKECKKIDIFKI